MPPDLSRLPDNDHRLGRGARDGMSLSVRTAQVLLAPIRASQSWDGQDCRDYKRPHLCSS